MSRRDVFTSFSIGVLAGILIWAVGRGIAEIPAAFRAALPYVPFVFPFFTLGAMAFGAIVGRRISVAEQFSKFLLVGGLNYLVDLGILNLLIAASGIASGVTAVAFKAVAFAFAATQSYFWNTFWTFRATGTANSGRTFAEFFMVSVGGLIVNITAFALVNSAIGPQGAISPETWASIGALAAAVAGLAANFFGYKFLVFRSS